MPLVGSGSETCARPNIWSFNQRWQKFPPLGGDEKTKDFRGRLLQGATFKYGANFLSTLYEQLCITV